MKKYLIIGGAGFIGSHLSEALLRLGNSVVVLDNFSTSAVGENNSKIKNYKTDVDNPKEVSEIFEKEKPDFVFHLAGAINLRRQITDELFLKDLDFLSRTKIILDACSSAKVKKIIFVSSGGAIYENAKKIPTSENYPAHPVSLYGLANLAIEKYTELYCQKNNLNFAILRLANVYGPRQWKTGIVPALVLSFLQGKNPTIYGNGSQTRDFVYINDAVDALVEASEKGEREIYNVGGGKELSVNKILELIGKITKIKVSPLYENLKVEETGRSALDIKKIEKEFGWKPKTKIEEGLIRTIEWYGK